MEMKHLKINSMKKFMLFAILGLVQLSRAADLYVNNSGQPGSYTTITAALTAAAPNDRVFVTPYAAFIENLTITQNVTLTSAVPGTYFTVTGTLTVTGAAGMDVRVIGGDFSSSVTATTGTATQASKADFYIVDCKFQGLTAQDYIKMHALFCTMGFSASIRHGEMRGCSVTNITVPDGPNTITGDTLFLVANVATSLTWQNNDNYFFMANNYVNTNGTSYTGPSAVIISSHAFSSTVKNIMLNNTFMNYNSFSSPNGAIHLSTTADRSNIWLYNNIIQNTYSSSTDTRSITSTTSPVGTVMLVYNYMRGGYTTFATAVSGNNTGIWVTLSVDNYGRSTDAAYALDMGSPGIEFYDIDLTRNNRGTGGGTYTMDNYLAQGQGRARVYDLTMPSEIWNGASPSVKAEGTHVR